ncbi:MAG: electron transfer flavoprotein subunit beta/FixA family protein [Cellulomonadaceae bacterium]|nr:electron transfer flavoprotein subunit beta/FixA family protein [Cellulomonadaceae bacterium]
MDILVLVKQVPGDLAGVTVTPSHTVDRDAGAQVLNPVDKNALEAAVTLKEAHGGTVTVLTLGPASARPILKECISVGADRGVHVSDEAFAGSDAWGTARVLAAAAGSLGAFDVVLAGARSYDGGTAAVAPMVAELLGLPQVTNVTGIESADGSLVCRQALDDGQVLVKVALPAVVTVDEYINKPRYASVKSKMAANKATFDVLTSADLAIDGSAGLAGSVATVVSASAPAARAAGVVIDGGSPAEIAEKLVAALAAASVL